MTNEIQELKFQVGEAWKGVYSPSTAYGLANVVQDPTGLSIYRSLKSGNVGHPLSNASWWFRIIDLSSIKAESDRIAALNQTIAQDEALRVAAEELRQQHEAERVAAETQRNEAEQQRISAEQARVNAESERATAEQQRITAEQGRVSAESARVQAEQARVLAETLRANAEDQRAANEQNRIAAEQQRIERAEQDHQRAESDHATYVDSLGAFDISSYHATDGVLAKYADLTAALGTGGANIPDDLRKGGMSVKFVQSSDNKYVQFRYMSSSTDVADFINVANWQGVDDEPTAGSDNLVKSGGVAQGIENLKLQENYFERLTPSNTYQIFKGVITNKYKFSLFVKVLNPEAIQEDWLYLCFIDKENPTQITSTITGVAMNADNAYIFKNIELPTIPEDKYLGFYINNVNSNIIYKGIYIQQDITDIQQDITDIQQDIEGLQTDVEGVVLKINAVQGQAITYGTFVTPFNLTPEEGVSYEFKITEGLELFGSGTVFLYVQRASDNGWQAPAFFSNGVASFSHIDFPIKAISIATAANNVIGTGVVKVEYQNTLNSKVENLQQEVSNIQQDITDIQQDITDIQQDVEGLQTDVESLEADRYIYKDVTKEVTTVQQSTQQTIWLGTEAKAGQYLIVNGNSGGNGTRLKGKKSDNTEEFLGSEYNFTGWNNQRVDITSDYVNIGFWSNGNNPSVSVTITLIAIISDAENRLDAIENLLPVTDIDSFNFVKNNRERISLFLGMYKLKAVDKTNRLVVSFNGDSIIGSQLDNITKSDEYLTGAFPPNMSKMIMARQFLDDYQFDDADVVYRNIIHSDWVKSSGAFEISNGKDEPSKTFNEIEVYGTANVGDSAEITVTGYKFFKLIWSEYANTSKFQVLRSVNGSAYAPWGNPNILPEYIEVTANSRCMQKYVVLTLNPNDTYKFKIIATENPNNILFWGCEMWNNPRLDVVVEAFSGSRAISQVRTGQLEAYHSNWHTPALVVSDILSINDYAFIVGSDETIDQWMTSNKELYNRVIDNGIALLLFTPCQKTLNYLTNNAPAVAIQNNLPYIDMIKKKQVIPPSSTIYGPDGTHLSDYGNTYFYDELKRVLNDE